VVRKLESGDLTLEESLKVFEEGVRSANFCVKKLDEAERKVELLLKQKDGAFVKRDFSLDEEQ
jgi:exodeoxyribonuclease VII small subunit